MPTDYTRDPSGYERPRPRLDAGGWDRLAPQDRPGVPKGADWTRQRQYLIGGEPRDTWELVEQRETAGGDPLPPPADLWRIRAQRDDMRRREIGPVLGRGEGAGLEGVYQVFEGNDAITLNPAQRAVADALRASMRALTRVSGER